MFLEHSGSLRHGTATPAPFSAGVSGAPAPGVALPSRPGHPGGGGPAEGQAEPSLSHGAPQSPTDTALLASPAPSALPARAWLPGPCPVTSHFQPQDLLLPEAAGRALPGLAPDQVLGQRSSPVGVAAYPCGQQGSCPASTVCQGGRCRMGLTQLRRGQRVALGF